MAPNREVAFLQVCDEQTALELVPVTADLSAVLKTSHPKSGALHLQIGSRYRIRIPSDFSGDALAEVIHILEQRR